MDEKVEQEKKKPYITPELTVHGDIGSLTETVSTSGFFDNGGAGTSKAS